MHANLASMKVSVKGGGLIVYLNNAKDTGLALGKIPDNCSQSEWKLWRENLELHLEAFPEFGPGVKLLFQKI